jgi:23S rRNA pseudouridine2605 synthase
MNPNAEHHAEDPEFEALIETAAEDAIGAAAEPTPGVAPESELPTREATAVGTEPEAGLPATKEPDESAPSAEPGHAPKLERLQKILAQAGVASRRHAEELIAAGRVQVNGQVVTTPGSKADPARDHIRVDGKLIHSAERHRYFLLNKPKGFVTTVSDPEGRPTVMQFFGKTHERLYPVGRLDYQSEGLLLVTNDGELANRLTRAASGVEKTYLVKVSGRPTPAELDALRHGVAIDRGRPGTSRVETAPARVREVRKGDNPWFEVVLIEGRNRELRKMFQEIGHFVEKIRRVGYGPLVLDVEPGKMRELSADEVAALRRAAEGKASVPKAKELRRREAREATGTREAFRPREPFGRPRESRPQRDWQGPAGERVRFGKAKSAPRRDSSPKPPSPDRSSRPQWKKQGREPWPPREKPSAPGARADRFSRPGAVRSSGPRSPSRGSYQGPADSRRAPKGEFRRESRGGAGKPFRSRGNPPSEERPRYDRDKKFSSNRRGRPFGSQAETQLRGRRDASPRPGFKDAPSANLNDRRSRGEPTARARRDKPAGEKRSHRR